MTAYESSIHTRRSLPQGRKLRTFLTTLAVVFGVLVIFGMNILLPTMLQAFQIGILTASGQVDVTITQKTGESLRVPSSALSTFPRISIARAKSAPCR